MERAVLVIDEVGERRSSLVSRLADRGLTPLAPRTPLEAFDLLARSRPDLCLVAATEMHGAIADSFPWVATAEITDDLDATVGRATAALAR
jgi:hypothetical protein